MLDYFSEDTQTGTEKQSLLAEWQPFPNVAWVRAGISLKADGGMSWNGMAMADTISNRRRCFTRNGLDLNQAVSADQVHETTIYRVSDSDRGHGTIEHASRIPATDALITNIPGIILTTLHADCAPIFYIDSVSGSIGLAHAGWRGILSGLPGMMLQRMVDEYQSAVGNLQVVVGPMISPVRYPVDDDLANRFAIRFGNDVIQTESGRTHLDLFKSLSVDLRQSGLPEENLASRPPCTAASHVYASYRRDGLESRSMLAWLMIR